MTTPAEDLQKKLEKDLRGMFRLEFQRNDINYSLSGVERGEITHQDIEDDMSVAISNWFVKDLLPAQQQALLDKVEKEVVGDNKHTSDRKDGLEAYSIKELYNDELKAEQRKALQRIKGELGEGAA